MKLTDFLTDVGRPVAYFPKLKRVTGSTTATILLCQFIYWRGKEANEDGWLYKTSEQIEDETGLSYNEQKTARKALVEVGLIQEHYARLDHEMRFLVNLDVINEKWGTLQPDIPESDDSTFGNDVLSQSSNDGLSYSLNESENTTDNKNTTENTTPEKFSRTDAPKRGDLVDMYLDMAKMPGIKREVRLDNILSFLGVSFSINTETKRWKDFAKFVDNEQQVSGRSVDVFVRWLKGQKDFDISYWPPSKMQEHYPRAFIKKTDEAQGGYATKLQRLRERQNNDDE
jgi:hypothetical protein